MGTGPFKISVAIREVAARSGSTRRIYVRVLRLFVTATICFAVVPHNAAAQTGAGAERYEVTITPPKRPGSESAAPAPGAPAPGAPAPAAPASEGSQTSPPV